MALSQISRSGNDAARAYFKKKVSEGKTKAQALVCLRRQLVNVGTVAEWQNRRFCHAEIRVILDKK